ncbi:MAG: dual specificity protein phosphatase family protein, partial [Candidatus Neptunochlamydia sp.]|nr:dual specificity protein phosphatase family protein [Candidatus Neptunochlamydia sp.]
VNNNTYLSQSIITPNFNNRERRLSRQETLQKGGSYSLITPDSTRQEPSPLAIASCIHKTSQNRFASCTYGGSLTTKVAKAMVLGIVAGLISFFTFSNPVVWAVGVAAGVFAVSLIAMQVIHIIADKSTATKIHRVFNPKAPTVSFKQMAEFKLSAWRRLGKKNFDCVYGTGNNKRIFLGALPNQKDHSIKRMEKANIKAVLSVNEPWERFEFGDSNPYYKEEGSWNKPREIDYDSIDALDHYYLDFNQLDRAADFINEKLKERKNVYVHCKSGMGRSAMAVAAYLIKYKKINPIKAANQIKENRPISTIQNKLLPHKKKGEGLNAYQEFCQEREANKLQKALNMLFERPQDYLDNR